MLTLLETTAAIKALDTEPDIIRNACAVIAYPSSPSTAVDTMDAVSLAHDMIKHYTFVEDKGDLLIAFLMAGANSAAVLCKPGNELTLLRQLLSLVQDEFTRARSSTMLQHYKNNPSAALKDLMAMIDSLPKR